MRASVASTIKILVIPIVLGVIFGYAQYLRTDINKRYQIDNSKPNYVLNNLPSIQLIELYSGRHLAPDQAQGAQLIHVWATWCKPCQTELPTIIAAARNAPYRNMQLTLIALDDDEIKVKLLLQTYQPLPPNVTVAMSSMSNISQRFGCSGIPETYLFDSSHKLILKFIGPQNWSETSLASRIAQGLAH